MRTQSVKLILSVLVAASLVVTCDKDDPQAEPTDVFVAGYVVKNKVSIATYWKNGIAVSLPSGPFGAFATAIAVNASGIYVAGSISDGERDEAIYWKNGVPLTLSEDAHGSVAWGITVNENDVYVAGAGSEGQWNVGYWKNNQSVISSQLNTSPIEGLAIALSGGGDLYVAGAEYSSFETWCGSIPFARYWKNGNSFPLPSFPYSIVCLGAGKPLPAGSANSKATAIVVNGNDVHVAGTAGQFGVYWKNGVLTSTLDPNRPSGANAIAVSGSDVFIAGWGAGSGAKYWKNGVGVNLGTGPNPISEAKGIAVFRNHVYVAGYESQNNARVATYWKDGIAVRLTDGVRSSANAIVVR